ncbi:MAG: hypothetical protein ACW98D_17055 [Promethearchaeota archaeon]|jgi:tetratricopeptide (TPR) repeat protein
MSDSIVKEIIKGWGFINEGREEEALQLVNALEQRGDLSIVDTLLLMYIKGIINFFLGSFKEANDIGNQIYEKSTIHNISFGIVEGTILKILGSIYIGNINWKEFYPLILESRDLLDSSIPIPFELEEGDRLYIEELQGIYYFFQGNFNLALNYIRKALEISKKVPLWSYNIPYLFIITAWINLEKGNIDNSVRFFKEAFSLMQSKNAVAHIQKVNIYRGLGLAYHRSGNLELAKDNYIKAIELCKDHFHFEIGWGYADLIHIFIHNKLREDSVEYLKKFRDYNNLHQVPLNSFLYQLSEARLLKSSMRLHNLVKAETMLKNIIDKEDLDNFLVQNAITELCNLHLIELRISDDVEILTETEILINKLITIAENQQSYTNLARTKLIQGKLALIQLRFEDARHFLSEGQFIADTNGLDLLANGISKEHDKLLDQMENWEIIKNSRRPISERLDLASIDDAFDQLTVNPVIESPEMVDEEPILLLIMDNSGATYFNHPFLVNWDYSDLFSDFMSAFNTFMDEIFSKSIDRIRVGENTILINPVEPFLACYVIKGQSYPALQKLTRFTEAIRENTETSEMLELDKPPALKNVINEIFS